MNATEQLYSASVNKHTTQTNCFESYEIELGFTHLLSFLVCRRGIRLHIVKLCLHAIQPLIEVVMSTGEPCGQLQGLLQRAEGFAAAGRHLSIARLDAIQLLLDQENLLTCKEKTWLTCQGRDYVFSRNLQNFNHYCDMCGEQQVR